MEINNSRYKQPERVDEPLLNILSESKVLFEMLKNIQHFYYDHLVRITNVVKAQELTKDQMVDVGFLCRESEHLLDDLRKDCKARQEFIGAKLSMQVTQESLTDENINTTVRGTLARGETDVRKRAKLPQKGTPEYNELMDHFFIPKRIIDTGVLTPSWNKIGDLVSECAEEGKPMPPGIKETYTEFITKYVKNR